MTCDSKLTNFLFQAALQNTSKALYTALDGRASLGAVTVLLPSHWPDSCLPAGQNPIASVGEAPDIRIGITHPVYGDTAWTQQSQQCGQPGDFMYISHKLLMEPRDLGNILNCFSFY